MNLAERFAGELGCEENPLTPHFNESVSRLVQLTARPDADGQLRTAAYEVLNAFITNAGHASSGTVASLSDVILQRLEDTIPMQQQVVSVEDKMTLEDIQTSLTSVVSAIIQRLEGEIKPQADRIMQILLQLLNTVGGKSIVPDTCFTAIGALATALEEDFIKYMDAFAPFLFKALSSKDEPALCAMAIGLVSDISRSLGPKCQPYCDQFMNHLLDNLKVSYSLVMILDCKMETGRIWQSQYVASMDLADSKQSVALSNQVRPAILQCFGDIAQAIGGDFEVYLSIVAQVLDQAASVNIDTSLSYEMLDYVVSLREGIMDAWGGAVIAMKAGNKRTSQPFCDVVPLTFQKQQVLQPYVPAIFHLLNIIFQDQNRSEALLRASMGGDWVSRILAANLS